MGRACWPTWRTTPTCRIGLAVFPSGWRHATASCLIGIAAVAALWATGGSVATLVVMYSINVFLTFSLSMIGMAGHWYQQRGKNPLWLRRLVLFSAGATLCLAILAVNIFFKVFYDAYYHGHGGGWMTIAVTGTLTGGCFLIHRYYRTVTARLKTLDESLGSIEVHETPSTAVADPAARTAVILVGGYSGLGVHTLLNAIRFMPHHFENVVFISVGVVDSGNFKGIEELGSLKLHVESSLEKYVDLRADSALLPPATWPSAQTWSMNWNAFAASPIGTSPTASSLRDSCFPSGKPGTKCSCTIRRRTLCSGDCSGTGFRWSSCRLCVRENL